MLSPIYEARVICDNCGNLVSRRRVDAATFALLAQQEDGPPPEIGPDTWTPDDGNVVEEEEERPVEVIYEHVSVCRRCADTP